MPSVGGSGGGPRSYVDTIMDDRPIAYWRLGETELSIAFDSSGNSRHGVYDTTGDDILGQPGALSDDDDTAVAFTGVDRVSISSDLFFMGSAPYTVELWAMRGNESDTAGFRGLVSRFDTSGMEINGWELGLENAIPVFRRIDDVTDSVSALIDLSTERFVHLVGVWDGERIFIYRDGVVIGDLPSNTVLTPLPGLNTFIGARGNTGYEPFVGVIDEVAIYDYALSPTQIQTHREAAAR